MSLDRLLPAGIRGPVRLHQSLDAVVGDMDEFADLAFGTGLHLGGTSCCRVDVSCTGTCGLIGAAAAFFLPDQRRGAGLPPDAAQLSPIRPENVGPLHAHKGAGDCLRDIGFSSRKSDVTDDAEAALDMLQPMTADDRHECGLERAIEGAARACVLPYRRTRSILYADAKRLRAGEEHYSTRRWRCSGAPMVKFMRYFMRHIVLPNPRRFDTTPRFFFHLGDCDELPRDRQGTEFPDLEAAQSDA